MEGQQETFLDNHLRLRLAALPPEEFERFFLGFLNSGVSLSINRSGKLVERRVISAELYAPGTGKNQDGIDLRLEIEGDEVWVVQCKRVQDWDAGRTKKAIARASDFPARHYFLAVACDTDAKTHQEIAQHPDWTLWNLDTICTLFKGVAPAKRANLLPFLNKEEVKRFLPFNTHALISPEEFFKRYTGVDKPLRHDWRLVGRESELERLAGWAESDQKALILTARGGEGKTRLIREFCDQVIAKEPQAEVLFLNTSREDSDFSLGLKSDASRRIIVIDDAHRVEQVPLPLLDLARKDSIAKIILASRPQGKDSIINRLREIGYGPTLIEPLTLGTLKKSAARELANAVLGDDLSDKLTEFVRLTDSNPFLITTAGSLLREHRMQWGSWGTDADFRQHVFEKFETENLKVAQVPEGEREDARRLLRLMAILSPVSLVPIFVEKTEKLIPGIKSTERLLNFIRVAELIVGPEEGLRVSPDLFADFLVYEACYEPNKRVPLWIKKVLLEFVEHGAVLIRNLSEASWIAELNGVKDDSIFEPLMQWQREEFRAQSFVARQSTLRNWTTSSQYLPRQSLELAHLAMKETTAPADDSPFGRMSVLDDHDHVLGLIPSLLRPVAKYHLSYSHEALDVLWELGQRVERPKFNNQNHPWTVISEVFKFEDTKPRAYYESALDWLEKNLQRPETKKQLKKPNPILRLFMEPCFSRTYDASYMEGRTIHFVEKHVSFERSQFVRDRCFALLAGIVEQGPEMATLDALSALEIAMKRAGTKSERGIRDAAKYREQWRPERLKALALYGKALAKYSSIAVRYEVRRTLKRDLTFEEDEVFGQECRAVLNSIPDDLMLRTAVAVVSDYAYEFEDLYRGNENPNRFSESQQRWNDIVATTARAIIEQHPRPEDLYQFLTSIGTPLTEIGHSLTFYPLLTAIGNAHTELGADLAEELLSGDEKNVLLSQWTALIDNSHISPERKFDLFEQAVNRKIEGAGVAVIRHLSGQVQKEEMMDERSRGFLLRIADHPELLEAVYLLQTVTYSSDTNLSWTFELLEKLTRERIDRSLLGPVLTALMPIQGRKTNPPASLVNHVFKQLIAVPDLGFYEHAHSWQSLRKEFPFETFELLRNRIDFSKTTDDDDYTAIPHEIDGRMTLPELSKNPRIAEIVDDLWARATATETDDTWHWAKLFHAVAFSQESLWHDRMVAELRSATSEDALIRLRRLINFDGSLIIFGFPEITELFLGKAKEIGGEELRQEIRAELYGATGPKVRSYSGGTLDREHDYVEAAAVKASEEHAQHPILGPFYRWIVEAEQADKLRSRLRAEESLADE